MEIYLKEHYMRVIINNEHSDSEILPPELESIIGFQFGEEVNIPVATYNAIFNLTFTNSAGMQQNRFKIIVISMDESPEEVEQKAEIDAVTAAQEEEFEQIVLTLDKYEALLSGVATAHAKHGISTDSAPNSAIALFLHLNSPEFTTSEPEE